MKERESNHENRTSKGEIIGNGDIAKALMEIELQDKLYFASGVSNSQETRESEYQREIDLLLQQDKSRHIVYFSSLCIFYSDTRYANHKRSMEEIIKDNFPKYTIVRLGTITWGDNPNTIINALRNKLLKGEPFEIRDETRYIIDREEFHHWIKLIPDWNCELNVTGQPMKISEIVEEFIK